MNDSAGSEASEHEVKLAASRKKLLLIFACFGIPLVLATIWLQVVRYQGGTWGNTSHGELIHPAVPLEEFSLNQFIVKNNGETAEEAFHEYNGKVGVDELQKIWTMLYMPEGDCLEACKLNLYHMRQVRLALNNRMTRVQRVVLMETEDQINATILADHLGLRVLSGTSPAVESLRGQIRDAEKTMESLSEAIYIVDPLGNVMMRFPPDLEPGKMIKDLKHLLKVSRIG